MIASNGHGLLFSFYDVGLYCTYKFSKSHHIMNNDCENVRYIFVKIFIYFCENKNAANTIHSVRSAE